MKEIKIIFLLVTSLLCACTSEKESIKEKLGRFNINFKDDFQIIENTSAPAFVNYSETIIIGISHLDRYRIQNMFTTSRTYTDSIPPYSNDYGKEEKTEKAYKVENGYYYELLIPKQVKRI